MKQFLLAIFLGLSVSALAQDAIYTKNGNMLPDARLTDVQDDKVSFTINGKTQTFKRENILFAFTSNGNYLVVNELSPNTAKAQEQLKAFLAAPPRNDDRDYLIRAVPLSVIPAIIAYESDQLVNYNTPEGKSGSISKGELVAILHRDGRHNILRTDYVEVSPLLVDVHGRIRPTAPSIPVQTTSVTAPDPTPIAQPVTAAPIPAYTTPATAPATVTTQLDNIPAAKGTALSLTNDDRQYYRNKSLQRVDEFVSYLNVITNKSLSMTTRDEAIRNAAKLFMPGATMEVTSKSQPGSRRYPIAVYLNRLKLLPYNSTKIEWTEVDFIKELTQAADGNYYGTITGEQRFTGYGTNRVLYEDVVEKNVRVKLERMDVERDGQQQIKWNLLLGSIGVSH